MGSHGYRYFVPYQRDLRQALAALRQQEFQAGRYYPVMPWPDPRKRPGKRHESIEEAVEAAAETGTRSILDIERIGACAAVGVASPLPREILDTARDLFGDVKLTRELLEDYAGVLFDDMPRGRCHYVVLHKDEQPHEICFIGWSFD
jgi:hypothetical protein